MVFNKIKVKVLQITMPCIYKNHIVSNIWVVYSYQYSLHATRLSLVPSMLKMASCHHHHQN